jgi:hypothetical protein
MAEWYPQFKSHVLLLDFAFDRGKHAPCDDVAHILMVKFETYQIQMGAMISDFHVLCVQLDALKNVKQANCTELSQQYGLLSLYK